MVRENGLLRTHQVTGRIEQLITEHGLDPVEVGTTANVQRTIRRARFNEHGTQDLGKTLATLNIPPNLQKTLVGEDFLLYDNKRETARMIIFASKSSLDVSLHEVRHYDEHMLHNNSCGN